MLLFKGKFHAGLVSGAITLTFRAWAKARVKPGGRYRCHPIGVLVVDAVTRVRADEITAADAARAGFGSREELLDMLGVAPGIEVFRVELHHGGDGDRVDAALDADLSAEDVATLRAKLARLDAKAPWTAATLALIAKSPRVAASKLAARLGRETKPFKADVRKLKRLGLTQSFEVGYEVSPRGRAWLAATRKKHRR